MFLLPKNYKVKEIPFGCFGIAGSFRHENEHFDISMKIGEMALFPVIREAEEKVIISTPVTLWSIHIKNETGKQANHSVEVLYETWI